MRTLFLVLVVLAPSWVHAEEQKTPAKPKHPGLVFIEVNKWGAEEWARRIDGAVMIRIPRGVYLQRPYDGHGIDRSTRHVEVDSFFIDKFEVTNDQAAKFLNAVEGASKYLGPSQTDLVLHHLSVRPPPDNKRWAAAPGRGQHPAVALTGEGAAAFATWVGGSVPLNDQWEKAAGGPQGLLYPWGDATPDKRLVNFARPEPTGLERVGSHAAGASPYGVMDMAGNAYDRVLDRPDMLVPTKVKGGSWLSPHPLNLRVLDMCRQHPRVAERSVGFRCVIKDQDAKRPSFVPATTPRLRIAKDMMDAVEEAQERRVPIFLSLQYDTCGQCDRMRVQQFRDPRFVKFCNENMVVIIGHQSGQALSHGHKPRRDGKCPFYPSLECWEHHTIFRQALRVVQEFKLSPGNCVLHPDHFKIKAPPEAFLIKEDELSKWGNDVDGYLAAFSRAITALKESDAQAKAVATDDDTDKK